MTHDHTTTWKEFDENPLTHSAAHYLMAVRDLRSKNGYARVTDIARHMDITPGSCSLSLKALRKRGLLEEDENKFVLLSARGEQLADMVDKNEKILESFFTDILKVSASQAEIDACKMEHLVSTETASKMCQFIGFIQKEAPDLLEKFNATACDVDDFLDNCRSCETSCASKACE